MLLPNSLKSKKLNGGRHWAPIALATKLSATTAPPPAYGRIVGTPCVAGDNDQLGDCFPTACANAVQTHITRAGGIARVPDSAAIMAYEGMAGYVPGNPSTDQGTDPNQGFPWWMANPIAGFKLASVASIAPTAEDQIREAIALTGGVLLCVELSEQNQNQRVWMPEGTAGSWGGHAIFCDQYDGDTYRVTSWGEDFYVDRSYFNAPDFVIGVFELGLTAA